MYEISTTADRKVKPARTIYDTTIHRLRLCLLAYAKTVECQKLWNPPSLRDTMSQMNMVTIYLPNKWFYYPRKTCLFGSGIPQFLHMLACAPHAIACLNVS